MKKHPGSIHTQQAAWRRLSVVLSLALATPVLAATGADPGTASPSAGPSELPQRQPTMQMRRLTNKEREAAAKRREEYRARAQKQLEDQKRQQDLSKAPRAEGK